MKNYITRCIDIDRILCGRRGTTSYDKLSQLSKLVKINDCYTRPLKELRNKRRVVFIDHASLSRRHPFNFFTKRPPIICLKLGVLHPFLTPILVQSTDVILRCLEEYKLIAYTFLYEDSASMLFNDRLLVLIVPS